MIDRPRTVHIVHTDFEFFTAIESNHFEVTDISDSCSHLNDIFASIAALQMSLCLAVIHFDVLPLSFLNTTKSGVFLPFLLLATIHDIFNFVRQLQ